jgi:small subunit ribosomal protein S6e
MAEGMAGYHPKMEGQRRRKMIRSKEITADFVQINAIVTAYGEKALEEIFPAKPKEEKKEGAPEARAPAKKKK